jgi:hypothetical protein
MEYLMTYGWAILIIAVVLGALFQLGVFNANNFAPRATPGSCQVYRPAGPWSVTLISLTGVCSGELPQYVAAGNGYALIRIQNALPQLNQFTFVGWISNQPQAAGQSGDALVEQNACGVYLPRSANTFSAALDTCNCKYVSNSMNVGCTSSAQISGLAYSQWYMMAITVDASGNVNNYVYTGAGKLSTASFSESGAIYDPSGTAYIGSWGASPTYPLNGLIANIQVYNTSLSANEIQTLYLEGIGGAPLVLQNLVGWWPLNGDANDYSGNGNNGQATNVIYTGSWTSGYTPP